MNTYDLPKIRRELILIRAKTLKESSRFYKEDYEAMCKAVNSMTRKELLISYNREIAIQAVTPEEIRKHYQI